MLTLPLYHVGVEIDSYFSDQPTVTFYSRDGAIDGDDERRGHCLALAISRMAERRIRSWLDTRVVWIDGAGPH
jgi:hypothetical protein